MIFHQTKKVLWWPNLKAPLILDVDPVKDELVQEVQNPQPVHGVVWVDVVVVEGWQEAVEYLFKIFNDKALVTITFHAHIFINAKPNQKPEFSPRILGLFLFEFWIILSLK